MAASSIRNPSVEVCAMPYPFQGILQGGQTIILSGTPAQLAALCPSLQNAFLVNDLGSYAGATDDATFGAVTETSPNFAGLTLNPFAETSGSRAVLTVRGAADTGVTASTEQSDVYFNLARTVTWATGALTTQRAVRIAAPTYAFAAASTVTTAVTVDISGAPVAGTNATLTNSYALRVASGPSLFSGSVGVGGAPAASAALTVTSTTQGLLFPRMTTAERDAISAPAAGLVIYNTSTNKLNLRVAAAWEVITSA
jgi:hypothetical protein